MRHLTTILGVILVGCAVAREAPPHSETPSRRFPVPLVNGKPAVAIANPLDRTNSPIIAVWERTSGFNSDTNYPYLRVAVWADGSIVFSRDPNVWNHDLLLGQLPGRALAKLKQDIRQTGVFELKGQCYLVPDAPVDCVMLSFGGSRQMLYWDEVENNSYGINVNPTPQHLAFKKAWWEVNRLVLSTLPDYATKLDGRFLGPPKEWYLTGTIQSE